MKKLLYTLFVLTFTLGATVSAQKNQPIEKDIEILSISLSPAPEGGASLLSLGIKNNSNQADQLIYASSPSARKIEFHIHQEEDGIMRMEKISNITIPAGATMFLGQGNEHVMLYPKKPLYESEPKINVELHFRNNGIIRLLVPVVARNR